MIRLTIFLCLLCGPTYADSIIAARTIPAKSIITDGDFIVQDVGIAGAASNPDAILGMEARVALYAGRPIRLADVGAPATVDRNQIITLFYLRDGLAISTDARALGRAGPGDRLRVMNLSSRSTVMATIGTDGAAYVQR
jgi:flagella basal body P-ring formation protein FlgA